MVKPARMLPIRDHNPSQSPPLVTYALIVANVGLFLAYWPGGSDASVLALFRDWGLVPARLGEGQGWATLVTMQFLHAGWLHLGFNMLFLRIFGDTLEEAWGPVRFLGFYLFCGVLAGAFQWAADPSSGVPVVGASGAVAGVLGGYLLMFPRARIDVVVWLVVQLRVIVLPAWLLLGLWLAVQVFGGLSAPSNGGGIAFWAHVGGFLAGVALTWPLWRARGGRHFWRRHGGHPPNPAHPAHLVGHGAIPVVRRRGVTLPPPVRGPFRRP